MSNSRSFVPFRRLLPVLLGAMALSSLTGCGPEADEVDSEEGYTVEDREQKFTDAAELNLATDAVTRLARALDEDWAEEKKSCKEWSGIREDRLLAIFQNSEDLSREFPDFIEPHNNEALQMIYKGLREILYNGHAIRAFRDDLENGRFRSAYAQYPPMRKELLKYMGKVAEDDAFLPPEGEAPTIVVNIPGERLQAFYDGIKIHDEQVVVGQRDYDNYNENSKTRVGDHAIASWHHCYSNASYPSWCDDKKNGAFGEWTAKLDRGYQYLHGSIGSGVLNWAAIKFAPGSHGCVRNRNSHISDLHDMAPEGTAVRKIYTVTERYAKVSREQGSSACKQDPFGDGKPVEFRISSVDNQYHYDVDSVPEELSEDEILPERPNGVYYRDTGVTVGYAHPFDAVTQPF